MAQKIDDTLMADLSQLIGDRWLTGPMFAAMVGCPDAANLTASHPQFFVQHRLQQGRKTYEGMTWLRATRAAGLAVSVDTTSQIEAERRAVDAAWDNILSHIFEARREGRQLFATGTLDRLVTAAKTSFNTVHEIDAAIRQAESLLKLSSVEAEHEAMVANDYPPHMLAQSSEKIRSLRLLIKPLSQFRLRHPELFARVFAKDPLDRYELQSQGT